MEMEIGDYALEHRQVFTRNGELGCWLLLVRIVEG